ncbi:MAG: M23 family metallopeptidase, partial [Archangium sp.]|nr:M23 family metallopeptidase [Archangium sp.]
MLWRSLALCLFTLSACATTSTVSTTNPTKTRREPRVLGDPNHPQLTHLVEKGQTLYRIARAYSLSVEELMDANRIDDPRELKAGELLYIPGSVQKKSVPEYDSPEPEAQPRPLATNANIPEKKPPKLVKVGKGTGVLEWPLRGVLYARFGKKGKEPHDGIDLAAPAGQPVKTAAIGTVLFAG